MRNIIKNNLTLSIFSVLLVTILSSGCHKVETLEYKISFDKKEIFLKNNDALDTLLVQVSQPGKGIVSYEIIEPSEIYLMENESLVNIKEANSERFVFSIVGHKHIGTIYDFKIVVRYFAEGDDKDYDTATFIGKTNIDYSNDIFVNSSDYIISIDIENGYTFPIIKHSGYDKLLGISRDNHFIAIEYWGGILIRNLTGFEQRFTCKDNNTFKFIGDGGDFVTGDGYYTYSNGVHNMKPDMNITNIANNYLLEGGDFCIANTDTMILHTKRIQETYSSTYYESLYLKTNSNEIFVDSIVNGKTEDIRFIQMSANSDYGFYIKGNNNNTISGNLFRINLKSPNLIDDYGDFSNIRSLCLSPDGDFALLYHKHENGIFTFTKLDLNTKQSTSLEIYSKCTHGDYIYPPFYWN